MAKYRNNNVRNFFDSSKFIAYSFKSFLYHYFVEEFLKCSSFIILYILLKKNINKVHAMLKFLKLKKNPSWVKLIFPLQKFPTNFFYFGRF